MSTYAIMMSGGVDSSCAAILLKEQGHDVIGLTMQFWSCGAQRDLETRDKLCCSTRDVADAQSVAAKFGFPHYIINMEKEFRECVIDPFCKDYGSGRTPNPCTLCNGALKFKLALTIARELGAEYIATGHYSGIIEENGQYKLMAADSPKDQSYFLFTIPYENLQFVRFPLYNMAKPDVRKLLEKYDLHIADKVDSQEICFIQDDNYENFLREEIPDKFIPGPIITLDGKEVGQHRGLPAYTIGQRRGIGVALGHPAFVVDIQTETNTLVLGSNDDLKKTELTAENPNWLIPKPGKWPLKSVVKIRYRSPGSPVEISENENGTLKIKFDEPQRAVTPGQAVVFYHDKHVLGGAWISNK